MLTQSGGAIEPDAFARQMTHLRQQALARQKGLERLREQVGAELDAWKGMSDAGGAAAATQTPQVPLFPAEPLPMEPVEEKVGEDATDAPAAKEEQDAAGARQEQTPQGPQGGAWWRAPGPYGANGGLGAFTRGETEARAEASAWRKHAQRLEEQLKGSNLPGAAGEAEAAPEAPAAPAQERGRPPFLGKAEFQVGPEDQGTAPFYDPEGQAGRVMSGNRICWFDPELGCWVAPFDGDQEYEDGLSALKAIRPDVTKGELLRYDEDTYRWVQVKPEDVAALRQQQLDRQALARRTRVLPSGLHHPLRSPYQMHHTYPPGPTPGLAFDYPAPHPAHLAPGVVGYGCQCHGQSGGYGSPPGLDAAGVSPQGFYSAPGIYGDHRYGPWVPDDKAVDRRPNVRGVRHPSSIDAVAVHRDFGPLYTIGQVEAMRRAILMERYRRTVIDKKMEPLPTMDYYPDGWSRRSYAHISQRKGKHFWSSKARDGWEQRNQTQRLDKEAQKVVQNDRWDWRGRHVNIERRSNCRPMPYSEMPPPSNEPAAPEPSGE